MPVLAARGRAYDLSPSGSSQVSTSWHLSGTQAAWRGRLKCHSTAKGAGGGAAWPQREINGVVGD